MLYLFHFQINSKEGFLTKLGARFKVSFLHFLLLLRYFCVYALSNIQNSLKHSIINKWKLQQKFRSCCENHVEFFLSLEIWHGLVTSSWEHLQVILFQLLYITCGLYLFTDVAHTLVCATEVWAALLQEKGGLESHPRHGSARVRGV